MRACTSDAPELLATCAGAAAAKGSACPAFGNNDFGNRFQCQDGGPFVLGGGNFVNDDGFPFVALESICLADTAQRCKCDGTAGNAACVPSKWRPSSLHSRLSVPPLARGLGRKTGASFYPRKCLSPSLSLSLSQSLSISSLVFGPKAWCFFITTEASLSLIS